MKNIQKDAIGFLLRFVGVGSKSPKQFKKHPVVIRSGANRRPNRAIWLEVGNIVKGALKPAKNVGGDIAEIVITKPIESAEKPGGDGRSVPAGRSKERRWRGVCRNGVKGVNKGRPSLSPALEGNSGGPKHGSAVNGQ